MISPDLQKEKNVTNAAVHSINGLKGGFLPLTHIGFSFLRIVGVIGSRGREAFPSFPLSALTPLRICFKRGIWSIPGSLKP